MEDVERVLSVILQAADVAGAELIEVDRCRFLAMHAAEVDLVLASE
jgi:hypothetical protein